MTENLNYISMAINQIRRATGSRAAPGESCEHIRITNPDRELKNGMFSFEPVNTYVNVLSHLKMI